MTLDRIYKAFVAYRCAIESKILHNDPTESIEDLARRFGRDVTTNEDLDFVSEFFNFDKLNEVLK